MPPPNEPPPTRDPNRPDAKLLLWAYRRGIFPMADPDEEEIGWYSPDPRGVIPLEGFTTPRSLARVVRQGRFQISSDRDFEAVMRACSKPRPQESGTWIDERMIAAYGALHAMGHAHSLEARRDGVLVGGLYGVHIGGAFFGESMFIRPDCGGTDASKVCLVHLVRHLRRRGFALLDTQFRNRHIDRFGCVEIPRERYLDILADAVEMDAAWGELEA